MGAELDKRRSDLVSATSLQITEPFGTPASSVKGKLHNVRHHV